jgi:hypothetical protein
VNNSADPFAGNDNKEIKQKFRQMYNLPVENDEEDDNDNLSDDDFLGHRGKDINRSIANNVYDHTTIKEGEILTRLSTRL